MSFKFDQVPPPYDNTSWTLDMFNLAEKLKYALKKSNLDRHSISQGIKLVSIAVDEYEQGNETVALNIYLTGVDKIIMALPDTLDNTQTNTKTALREKLESMEKRLGDIGLVSKGQLINDNDDYVNDYSLATKIASIINSITTHIFIASNINYQDPMILFKQFGKYIADWSVALAVFIKQSPLLDILTFIFNCILQCIVWLDSYYGVNKKIQNFGLQIIKLGLDIDQEYRLHEFISEGLCMIVTAGVKAAVAFKETPRMQ